MSFYTVFLWTYIAGSLSGNVKITPEKKLAYFLLYEYLLR